MPDDSINQPTLSLEMAKKIDEICDRFRSAWQSGSEPNITAFLREAGEAAFVPLLEKLLLVELDRRRGSTQSLCRDKYYSMFPDHKAVIDSVFSRVASTEDLSETKDLSQQSTGFPIKPLDDPAQRKRLGRFELHEILGKGGFGTVYRAYDPQLDRDVAIKFPRSGTFMDPDDVQRFLREARAAAQLRHRHIVPVHDAGEIEGTYYIATEFIAGATLRQNINKQDAITHREVVLLIGQLAEALHFAHTKGIVHRDMKPENVMIDSAREPHIMDFGLARRERGEELQTQEGAVMGTPAYMSPEQAKGESRLADARTDLWALGVMFYELLVGRRPFSGGGTEVILKIIESEAEPLRRIDKSIPKDLETICLKCLAKKANERYPSCQHLADELGRWLRREPIEARSIGRVERALRWYLRNPVVASLAVALLIILVAGVAASSYLAVVADSRARQADNSARAAIESGDQARDERNQKEKALAATALALEESNRQLVQLRVANANRYVENGDLPAAMLWVNKALQIDDENAERGDVQRRRLAALLRQQPMLRQILLHKERVHFADFSPDGSMVVTCVGDRFEHRGEARIWNTETGAPITPPLIHDYEVGFAAFSPDNRLLVAAGGFLLGQPFAQIWDVQSAKPISRRFEHESPLKSIRFSSDALYLYTTTYKGIGRIWDINANTVVSRPQEKVSEVYQAEISPDGRFMALATTDRAALIVRMETGQLVCPPLQHDGVQTVAFSPDSIYLATAGIDRTVRIWKSETGADVTVPLNHGHTVSKVSFSPDSSLLATTSSDGYVTIWQVANGRQKTRFKPPSSPREAVFSPDGRRVLTHSLEGGAQVWLAENGNPYCARLAHEKVWHAAFSPDGHRIVTASFDRAARIWELETGQPIEFSPEYPDLMFGASPASISSDGTRVATGWRGGTARVWELSSRSPLIAALKHGTAINHVLFSPEGRRIVTASGGGYAIQGNGRVFSHDGPGEAQVWDAENGQKIAGPFRHDGWINHAELNSQGDRLITASVDGTARVWSIETGLAITPPLAHGENRLGMQRGVVFACFSPDERLVVTTGGDFNARLWNSTTGIPVASPLMHEREVEFAAFSPDGSRVATASGDRTAKIWETSKGQLITEVRHGDSVGHVAFSPNGRWLITSSNDGTARIWDATNGQPVTVPLRHNAGVTWASFGPDNRYVVTASVDRTTRVWHAPTGEAVTPPMQHRHEVHRAWFSSDGLRVFTTDKYQSANSWDFTPDRRPLRDLTALAQLLSGRTLDATGAANDIEPEELYLRWTTLCERYPSDFTSDLSAALAWHRREAEFSEVWGRWQTDLFHLNYLIKANPSDSLLLTRRAFAQAELGNWHESASDFAQAIESGEADWSILRMSALAQLQAGDIAAFRADCRRFLDGLGSSDEAAVVAIVRTSSFAPLPEDYLHQALKLAENLAGDASSNVEHAKLLAPILFRLGQSDRAIELLEKSVSERPENATAYDYAILALASHAVGNSEEARKWLQRADTFLERLNAIGDDNPSALMPWHIRLEQEIMVREAKAIFSDE